MMNDYDEYDGDIKNICTSRSDVVYEKNRRKKLEEKSIKIINFLIAIILAASSVLTIAIFQYEEYLKVVSLQSLDNSTLGLCQWVKFANIDIVSSTVSFAITITFIIFSKRLSFMRTTFRYRNFGLPMISSSWNKNDRFNSCLIYGIIAYQVFTLVQNSLIGNVDYHQLLGLDDITGLTTLLVQILEVFLIGLRYYPVLVSAKCNSFVIVFMASLYMWMDLINLIFHIGKCNSVSVELIKFIPKDIGIVRNIFWYFLASKMLSAIPICIFSSFIVINLTYKSIIILTDYVLRSNSHILRALRPRKPSGTLFCGLCDIADDENMTYSQSDLVYVLQLLNNRPRQTIIKQNLKKISDVRRQVDYLNVKYDYTNVEIEEAPNWIKTLFRKYIYNWEQRFCFTSRFCQIQVVALLALYYFFVYFSYNIVFYWVQIEDYDVTKFESIVVFNISKTVCILNEKLCRSATGFIPLIELKLTDQFVQILPELKASINQILLAPLVFALGVCFLQQFLSIRECKAHLIQLYRGECEYIKKLRNFDNSAISESSFHFGGFFVGYLVWGYLILYVALFLFATIITYFRLLSSFETLKLIFFMILPFICCFILLHTITKIFASYVFLKRNSKILALNNFKVFNVFTYFYFYHDCLMGYVSAILRIINTVIAGIVMMPRISYSFLGRHLENLDNGYSTYSGFLHMEAAHTNPILICFCSLLYYKDLSEHLRRYKNEKRLILETEEIDHRMVFKLKKFLGYLPPNVNKKRAYDRLTVNKWHLLIRLAANRELIVLRKAYLVARKENNLFQSGLKKMLTSSVSILRGTLEVQRVKADDK